MVVVDGPVRDRVRQLIARASRTQGEFAARIGLEPSKLSRSLGGTRRFTVPELARIAEVGGVSVDWVIYGSGAGPVATGAAATDPGRRPETAADAAPTRAQRRDDFLRAASGLIAERGYHAVRVADIALACGTSSAAVHYYFPGKQDVLHEALRYCAEQAFARQDAELRTIGSGRQRLLRLIEMQLPRPGRVRDEWSIWVQFWAEAMLRSELRPVHNEFYARWRETIARVIARGQRQGSFRTDVDAADAALRFSALLDGVALQLLTGAPDMTPERMRRTLVEFVHRDLDALDD